jgi:meso-butanediol dehydrogenase/(S,S)-butanediol dehydrogenase/diacetyl reductase
MGDRLRGKRILIYGGGTGIGYGCAEAMAREGAGVFLSGRREDRLSEAAGKLAALGPSGYAAGDATGEADVARVTAAAVAAMGGLDGIVNSAGTSTAASILDETLEGFRQVCDANLVSTFLTCRQAVPHLKASGGGAIIAIASVLGLLGSRRRVAYCASKAGVIGMVRAMALDLADVGIRVNAICPGFVETELTEVVIASEPDPAAVRETRRRSIPIGRSGEPAEIGAVAVYLASDEAAWTTGQHFTIDGGFSIR